MLATNAVVLLELDEEMCLNMQYRCVSSASLQTDMKCFLDVLLFNAYAHKISHTG